MEASYGECSITMPDFQFVVETDASQSGAALKSAPNSLQNILHLRNGENDAYIIARMRVKQ